MNKVLKNILLLSVSVLLLTSCHSSKNFYKGVDIHELARAGVRLGFDIEYDDDMPLMIECSNWLGVPYRYGGTDKSGVDCSGLNYNIYNKVYGKKLHRRSIEQFEEDVHKVKQRKLETGNLVFFAISSNVDKKNINHTGIYLKNGNFIHASSSRGVVVDNLNSAYFQKYFVSGGRVK